MDSLKIGLMDIIDEIILRNLEEKDFTEFELAKRSGIPYATIKSILQKRTQSIDFKTLIKLANAFNKEVWDFIRDDRINTKFLDLN